jgi:predicted nucleotidyltransferase
MLYADLRNRLDLSIPALLDAGQEHGVENLRVFGSLARGDTGDTRDIDLLVDLRADKTLLDLVAFRREAEEILAMPVDVATVDMLEEGIRAKVLLEARSLTSTGQLPESSPIRARHHDF